LGERKGSMIAFFRFFGIFYTVLMVGLSLVPIFWMFQFFVLVPELRQFLYFMFLVPLIGIGAGLYGLRITRHQKYE
jgi:hypothetical protein